jgi:hypothetical protein
MEEVAEHQNVRDSHDSPDENKTKPEVSVRRRRLTEIKTAHSGSVQSSSRATLPEVRSSAIPRTNSGMCGCFGRRAGQHACTDRGV